MFFSHTTGVLGIGDLTKRPAPAITDLPTYPDQDFSFESCLSVVASLPPKNSVCEPERQNNFHDRNLLFWCWPIRSKDRIQLKWPRALKCLGFWRELPNTFWNVNFTTITRFPVTLNADFFMKQLLVKLCMWCGPLFSLYKIHYSERKIT